MQKREVRDSMVEPIEPDIILALEVLNVTLIGNYVDLVDKAADLDSKLKSVKAEMKVMEQSVLDELSRGEIQRLSIRGRTVFIQQQRWTRVKTDVDDILAIAVLDGMDLGDFHRERITIQTVSAWVREQIKQEIEIPPEFLEVFEITPVFKVGITKA